MAEAEGRKRLRLIAGDTGLRAAEFARDVREGLTARPRRLHCRWFYDAEGSRLFEEICRLPEYYLTRAERSIIEERAGEIAALWPGEVSLVELGSGSAAKTRLLLEAFLRKRARLRYMPVDISPTALLMSSRALIEEFPGLEVAAVAGDYQEGLSRMREETAAPRLILWLGSNIGNLDRLDAARFLRRLGESMEGGDRQLLGIDLRKDRRILERAYDDSRGITARFNLNLLERINRELGGRFDLSGFRHRALYDEERGCVEMYLDSLRAQEVRIERLDLEAQFEEGEPIHTESCYKYSPEEIAGLVRAAGLRLEREWVDGGGLFSLCLLGKDSRQE